MSFGVFYINWILTILRKFFIFSGIIVIVVAAAIIILILIIGKFIDSILLLYNNFVTVGIVKKKDLM